MICRQLRISMNLDYVMNVHLFINVHVSIDAYGVPIQNASINNLTIALLEKVVFLWELNSYNFRKSEN